MEHTYNSNAIEGSTLTKKETEAVIFDKSRLPDKSLMEHLEATNHAVVLRDIFTQKYPTVITDTSIRQLHRALLQGIRPDAGDYATRHRVIRGVNIALTHPKDIPEEMARLLRAWKRTERHRYTVADVATFHADFELIHPFGDGNGRVGRLVMLMQLLRRHYPPVVVETSRKAEYYEVLEYAQRRSIDPFVVFLVDEMERTSQLLRKHR
ncbi:MAG: Fic family protein [Candidatus Omnitrophota bacterium]|nr:Fic family protein [Candidatus Omnitrophota bacterium]